MQLLHFYYNLMPFYGIFTVIIAISLMIYIIILTKTYHDNLGIYNNSLRILYIWVQQCYPCKYNFHFYCHKWHLRNPLHCIYTLKNKIVIGGSCASATNFSAEAFKIPHTHTHQHTYSQVSGETFFHKFRQVKKEKENFTINVLDL